MFAPKVAAMVQTTFYLKIYVNFCNINIKNYTLFMCTYIQKYNVSIQESGLKINQTRKKCLNKECSFG